jgi:phosphate transport system permease protein
MSGRGQDTEPGRQQDTESGRLQDPGAGRLQDTGFGSAESRARVGRRHLIGRAWQAVFRLALVIIVVALVALFYDITNTAAGYAVFDTTIRPDELVPEGQTLEKLSTDALIAILVEHLTPARITALEAREPLAGRRQADLVSIVETEVVKPKTVKAYGLYESLLNGSAIRAEIEETHPGKYYTFYRWLTLGFITRPQSSVPEIAGVRTAVLGSLWVIAVTALVAFPLGVGAGIYLEEYADPNRRINQIIQTNIYNLAGVPSIIYGILGLSVFVRMMEPLTSGTLFGLGDPTTANGRTIISAGMTLALLVLPIIIINTQEAIRTVPSSLREASYGLGATRWQTVQHHVLPHAIPGILTGTILSFSRALGETAPLVVIGASTYITTDPTGPFAKFTTLPTQIYQWTSRPQDAFQNIAAAAIVVLLVLLLLLNSAAVYLRNRYTVRY